MAVVVVRVIVMAMIIMSRRSMGVAVTVVIVMLDLVAEGLRACAPNSAIEPGQNGAQQRQENDCLNHTCAQPFIRLTSSTAIEPRLRK